ncbi:coiled-coil domain-containing protein 189-like [Gigantopelta aegis]|uniref:coiled-coil domain-containing protein 189-like n=1 Tax=Gigantopelta aegis TaxID=1735272 RepID=UPI001B88A46C|nr:coiled-coil domain-containing protein 189-like [Gigantopelta aegis]
MKLETELEEIQTIPKIIQPREHKAKICVWADLTIDDIDRVNESQHADLIKQVLADIFHLDDYQNNLKNGVMMDLYYYTLQFARDSGFNREKTSVFFSIIKKTHEVCIETPFGNLDHTFNYFKALLLCHAVNRPPHSIELFNADEVRKITEYAINTYFRHFKMYKYVFTPLVKLDLAMNYIGMSMTPPPSETDDQEDQDTTLDEQVDTTAGETDDQKTEETEESPAKKELRTMIQAFLAEEIKKMKQNVDEQIKSTEETLSKKIESVEGNSPRKGGSGKGKRK